MKRVSILIAAAAAALAMTAAVGAGTASAGTVLCTKAVTTCAQSDIQPAGTYLMTGNNGESSEYFVLRHEGEKQLECGFNLMMVETTLRNGNPQTGKFHGKLTASRCLVREQPTSTCTSATMNEPGTTVEATKNGGGVIKVGSASDPLSLTYTCKFPGAESSTTCVYQATGTVTMTQAEFGESVKVSKAAFKKTSGLTTYCGLESGWTLDVNNVLDNSTPDYIAKATETVYCATVQAPCPNGSILAAGSIFLTGNDPDLSVNSLQVKAWGVIPVVTCDSAVLGFKSTSSVGASLATETVANDPAKTAGGCSYEEEAAHSCSTVTLGTQASSVEATGLWAGTARIGSASEPFTLSATCTSFGTPFTCSYKTTGALTLQLASEETKARVTAKEVALTRTSGSEFLCGGKVTLSIDNMGRITGAGGSLSVI